MGDEEEVFEKIDPSRRSFMRQLVVGTPLAVPAVSTFDVTSLSLDAAAGGPNRSSP